MTRRRSSPATQSWSPRPTPVRLAPGVDPRHPLVGLIRRQREAMTARDWTAYRALYAPGCRLLDRRPVGWGEDVDAALMLETAISAATLYPDMRQTTEILAVADGWSAEMVSFHGHTTAGGGFAEVTMGVGLGLRRTA